MASPPTAVNITPVYVLAYEEEKKKKRERSASR